MERILQSKERIEIDEIFKQIYDFNKNVVYFPIRHHSPICSHHLINVINEYNPDCILVEGIESANILFNIITDEDTKTPFAIYYSYNDKKGYVSKEKLNYKCYYPFLDYSPELVAFREGKRKNIPALFIDLPYAEMLISSKEGKGLRKLNEKNNYNDDFYLTNNDYIKIICEKTSTRDFNEFWEKYFEINGLYEKTEIFVKNMFSYCYILRKNTNKDELLEDACLSREKYMAIKISEYSKIFKKVLVVTGGFHTFGLYENLEKENKYKLHNINEMQNIYLMPYSMEATDALNGYASGMPYACFYQDVWENIVLNEEKPFDNVILAFISKVAKYMRKKDNYISLYDETCAYSMANNLAMLRNKKEPGAYELYDAILSSFVKGEYNISTDFPIRTLTKYMIGNTIGKLSKNAQMPPIVEDFYLMCKTFLLKIQDTAEKELILNIFSMPKHRELSKFLYRLSFLDVVFAKKIKGANLVLKKDKNLIREVWKYKWKTSVISELIDKSVYGGSIYDACISIVTNELKEEKTAKEIAVLLTKVFEMGLDEKIFMIMGKLELALKADNDFYSVSEAFLQLNILDDLKNIYNVKIDFSKLIETTYKKLLLLIPFITNVQPEEFESYIKSLKNIYNFINKDEYIYERENFCNALENLILKDNLNSGIEGCAIGILYGLGYMDLEKIEYSCMGYIKGTTNKLMQTASFLRGLFYTAKDLIFSSDIFINMIDKLINDLDSESFMELLPEFRIAFNYFMPSEIDTIAERVARIYGKSRKEFLSLENITPNIYDYGKLVNDFAEQELQRNQLKDFV